MRLYEPENYAQEGLKSWIIDYLYGIAYDVPMLDEDAILLIVYHFGNSTIPLTYF